jgi:hypothetical protein
MAAKSIENSRSASKKVTAVGNLDTPEKVRQLMRKIINYQLLKLLNPQQQTAINGSCNVILKCFEFEAFEDRILELENRFKAKQKKDKKKGKGGKYNQPTGMPGPGSGS